MPESRPATTSEVGFAGSCWGEGLRRCPGLCFPGTEWKGAYGVLFGEGAVAAEAIFLYFRLKKNEAVCGKGLNLGLMSYQRALLALLHRKYDAGTHARRDTKKG